MAKENSGFFGEGNSSTSVRESLSKYMANWPVFLFFLVLSIGCCMLYICFTVPKYVATTTFLIKGAEFGEKNNDDLIESAMNGKRQVNLNNEMLLIGSSALMERTVEKNGFNISYFKKGKLLNSDIYIDAPFDLIAKNITDSNHTHSIHLSNITAKGGSFSSDKMKNEKSRLFHWNEPFTVNGQTFILRLKPNLPGRDAEYIVNWQPVSVAAGELSKNFKVKAFDTKTSVIQLSLKTENIQRGKDVLNALFNEFNLSDIEDRNKLSDSTVRFIDDRLMAITNELKGVEGNLENYQGSRQLVDVKGQLTQSLENSSEISKTIKDVNIQQGIANMIAEYFANPNSNKLVPSSLGLNDPTLSLLITQYNELQLKKERELPSNAPNSVVIQDLNTQISSLKSSILESLNNIRKNLKLQENNFQQQNSKYTNFLSSLPHNERVMQEIKRKQSITEGLYLYLLQKREEAAISSTTSNAANYKQIDPATGYGPVEPNKKMLIIYSSLLGLFLAFGFIYVRNILNDKIVTREDITKRVSIPVIGEISHISKRKKTTIPALNDNLASEQLRNIRTNLSFILKNKKQKVVLVTSTASGEGKSFLAFNLAAVCAIPGSKVAFLEFDFRRPAISSMQEDVTKGLSSYLKGDINDLSELFVTMEEIPTLHIYPSGFAIHNPTDLLMSGKTSDLVERLKENYDYIIIDTPATRPVSDALILGEYSDVVLYVVRQEATLKKELEFINDIQTQNTLSNLHIIFNDIKRREKDKYYYSYSMDEKHSKKKKSTVV
jgi:capsular exopolysaccharide synthesis family protein